MELSVRLFAGLREAVGRDRVSVALPDGARVEDLVAALARAHAPLEKHRGRYAVAVNLAIAAPEQVLRAGGYIQIAPPVRHGAKRVWIMQSVLGGDDGDHGDSCGALKAIGNPDSIWQLGQHRSRGAEWPDKGWAHGGNL